MITRTEYVPFIGNGLVQYVMQFEGAGWAVRQIIEAGGNGHGFIVVFERERA